MEKRKQLTLLIVATGLLLSLSSAAQVRIGSYFDVGENNASSGHYLKAALIESYRFGKFRAEAGSQIDLISDDSKLFTGTRASVYYNFTVRDYPFESQALFIYNPYSTLVHESYWGVMLNFTGDHFVYRAGTGFRTYHITRKAAADYYIESDKALHENWNFMYLAGYNLKPANHLWNAGFTITNIDHFLINQETNPMLFINGSYKVSPYVTLYGEAWYKSAGSLNISANYFGYFIRTGILWEPDILR